jgi:hypothetical protein
MTGIRFETDLARYLKARLRMKRGFLFGLSSFLVVGVIGALGGALIGTSGLAGVVVALICMPLSVIAVRAAKLAPSHGSWLQAVVGWLLGFFAFYAVIFAAIGTAIIVPLFTKIL